MIKLSATQMAAIAKGTFYRRVQMFISERCPRADFRLWAHDTDRLHALWAPLWPAHAEHSEHDVSLAMVVVAACDHAHITLGGDALAVLKGIAEAEVRVKQWLAEQGYFDFTAFEIPAERSPGGAGP